MFSKEEVRDGRPIRRDQTNEQGAAMLSASVAEYDIADVRPLFGEGTA